MVLDVAIVEEDPATTDLLLLLLLKCTFRILTRLEKHRSVASLSALLILLVLDGAWNHVETLEKLLDILIRSLKG